MIPSLQFVFNFILCTPKYLLPAGLGFSWFYCFYSWKVYRAQKVNDWREKELLKNLSNFSCFRQTAFHSCAKRALLQKRLYHFFKLQWNMIVVEVHHEYSWCIIDGLCHIQQHHACSRSELETISNIVHDLSDLEDCFSVASEFELLHMEQVPFCGESFNFYQIIHQSHEPVGRRHSVFSLSVIDGKLFCRVELS